ncbi:hypothetical protein [Actinokineospora enzanensis]|uniref:hypothetical protein n=1 Tax=Actinokineospora enzanensis TaxID=155975 RepID=UPI001FE1F881|nr:hypothetical protein [Actinokineospora enzanensis]
MYRLRALPDYGNVSAWKPTLSRAVLRTVVDDSGMVEFWDGNLCLQLSGDVVWARHWDRIGDSYLLYSGREPGRDWAPERPEAWIVDADGVVEAELNFGRCVQAVAVDAERNIWVGYMDNAIPWPYPDGADATGRSGVEYWHPGLVRWDEYGKFHWVFAVDGAMVSTCVSINPGPHGVIAVTDADQPVVRVGIEGLLGGCARGLAGLNAVAFDGQVATLLGKFEFSRRRRESSYRHDAITRIDVETGEVVGTGRLVMPDGQLLAQGGRIPPYRMAVGRGNTIAMVFGNPGVAHVLEL